MRRIISVLMERDGLTKEEAVDAVREMQRDLMNRLAEGDFPYDICEEYFGLEPDYLEDVLM